MDTILCPREQPLSDLEAGPVKTELSEIQTAPKFEETDPLRPGMEHYRIRECQCFPDGETKDQCQERFKVLAEEQKKLYGINKICVMLN